MTLSDDDLGVCFYDLPSWVELLKASGMDTGRAGRVGSWLQGLLGASQKTA